MQLGWFFAFGEKKKILLTSMERMEWMYHNCPQKEELVGPGVSLNFN